MRADVQSLTNANLESIDAKKLLKRKPEDQRAFWSADKANLAGSVPLVSTGALLAGVAYPSSAAEAPPFYLPRYALRRQDGTLTTRLARNAASDDPSAPVGSLTIEIEALAPSASAAAAIMMPHEVTALRLGYRIPLGTEPADAAAPGGTAALAGHWRNLDPDADGIVALSIEALDAERLAMRCKTTEPANDGATSETQGFYRDGEAMAMFHLPDRFITLHMRVEGTHLRAAQVIDVLDGNTPGDGMASHVFARDAGTDEAPLIWFDLEPPVAAGQTVWRSATQLADDETYLRLFKVMTDGEHAARLEARCSATVGHRTWKQVFVGNKVHERIVRRHAKRIFLLHKQDAQQIRLKTSDAVFAQPHLRPDPRATPTLSGSAPTRRGQMAVMRPDSLSANAAATTLNRPVAAVRPFERVEAVRPVPGVAAGTRPVLHGGMATLRPEHLVTGESKLQMMAVMKHELGGARPPRAIVIDPGGVPVLTQRREETVQRLAPFWFDSKRQPQMFDAPPEQTGRLVLLRHEIRAGERSATFYQDGLEPRQIYYEPEEFRLARSDTAPYAPSILFHMGEELDADSQDADGIAFSVTLTYRALPFLHPSLLRAARDRFGSDAAIAPVAPVVSKLRLRLPGDADAALEREGAEIDFTDGLTDVLTFTEAEYRRLTTALQTVSGVALEGEVEATLLDGRTARIPIRIGLRETVGAVFDWAVTEAADGRCALALRNRIESPVRIDDLPVVALGAGANAAPESVPPAGAIPPGETVSVSYRVTPSGASVASFDPAPVTSTDPNLMAILAQTTVVQGYADDTFDVTLSIDPLFFEVVAQGARPLTGVRVEFRTREEPVLLTPAQPTVTVTLQMPLLLFVTNAAEAQHYSYKVTNLHADGPGAATAFTAGSGNLEVTPAPLQPVQVV